MSDAELISKFCNGDTGAFNTLVNQWQHRIHRVAYRFFNSHDEAQEITQKTFIKAYKKLHTLDDYAAFPAWIYRITNNLCRDEHRRAGRRRSAPLEEIANHPVTQMADHPDQPLQQKEWSELLQQALQQLPDEQRMIVIMKEYEELKFREIAKILDLPENTVKSRMYYGLSKLRDIFDRWNINEEALYHE